SPCIFATLASPYRGFLDYSVTGDSGEDAHIPTSNVEHQNVLQHPHGLSGYHPYMQPQHTHHTLQHGPAGHPTYSDIETHQPLHPPHLHRISMSHTHTPSPYDVSGYSQTPQPPSAASRKRSRPEDHLPLDLPNPLEQPSDPYGQPAPGYPLQPSYHSSANPQAAPPQQSHQQQQQQQQQQQHHHHRLPGHRSKMMRTGMDSPTSPVHHQPGGPPSVVGQAGMPDPAPRPKGPKLKFTPEDDQLLVDLKEKKNLTWKQIADFFPGRSSGTLQVRYCTKLKAKTTVWTDEMVQKLRTAMQDYENDRWRIISAKVGSGFSPAACRDKAMELEEGVVEEEEEQSGYTQAQLGPGPSDPGASFQ
ncbi:hypothetical protein BS50DRAFT_645159, partial [Corynespora cassiicola Philippines]